MALLVQLLVEAMGSECLQFDDPKLFTLKDDLVDLCLCFSICVPDLFNNCKLYVLVEIVSVSMEVFARRDEIICWMVCIGSVVIQLYVEGGFAFANILRFAFSVLHVIAPTSICRMFFGFGCFCFVDKQV